MTNMQWAGWVGRNIFNIYFFVCAKLRRTELISLVECRLQHTRPNSILQFNVDKSGARDCHFCRIWVVSQKRNQQVSHSARIHASRFGQNHRRIHSNITMRCIARGLSGELAQVEASRQLAVRHQSCNRISNNTLKMGKKIHDLDIYSLKQFNALTT